MKETLATLAIFLGLHVLNSEAFGSWFECELALDGKIEIRSTLDGAANIPLIDSNRNEFYMALYAVKGSDRRLLGFLSVDDVQGNERFGEMLPEQLSFTDFMEESNGPLTIYPWLDLLPNSDSGTRPLYTGVMARVLTLRGVPTLATLSDHERKIRRYRLDFVPQSVKSFQIGNAVYVYMADKNHQIFGFRIRKTSGTEVDDDILPVLSGGSPVLASIGIDQVSSVKGESKARLGIGVSNELNLMVFDDGIPNGWLSIFEVQTDGSLKKVESE